MKIAAYCRVSTKSAEQLDSLENQQEFFKNFADTNNYELVKIYADEGISGKQMKNRKEFLKMLDDSKLKIFDTIFVKDISRFARNTVDFLTSIRELKSAGIEVKFIANNQTILGDSEFVLTIFSAMAQEESANLSKRVKFGKKINAKMGRVPTRVYGYKRIDNYTLEPDENEADIVREIFDLYVNKGNGVAKIVKNLTSNAVPSKLTKSPKSWNSKTVTRILLNPIYIGKHINNKGEIKDFLTGTREKLPESQHLHHDRPSFRIISDSLFYEAQEKLQRNRELYKNNYTHIKGRESSRHIFSTLIRCEHCGLAYSRKSYTYKNTRTFWICPGFNNRGSEFCDNNVTIEEQDMLDNLKNQFTEIISNKDDFIKETIAEYNKSISENKNDFDSIKIENQISKLNQDKEKFKSMFIADIITIDELKESVANIEIRIQEATSQISKYKRISEIKENINSISLNLVSDIESLLGMDNWDNTALKRLIETIKVNKDGTVHTIFKRIK